jgi:ribosomal protein L7/L12
MAILGVCHCCGGRVSSEAKTCPHCGQPLPFIDKFTAARLEAKTNKINAIMLVREITGMGLFDAKNLVDSWKD